MPPIYLFEHPDTQEIKEIIMGMNDKKEYTDKKGVKWNRVFTKPQASIDTQIDPHSAQDFDNKLANKKGMTVGEMWNESKTLSKKREKIHGKDPIKEKSLAEYSKIRKGRIPPGVNTD